MLPMQVAWQKGNNICLSIVVMALMTIARAPINDHSVFWNYPINTMAQLVINKQHVLGSCELKLEIIQELSGGKETHTVGTLSINLSEYAESGVTTRRYLLDDCKFNSTVKASDKDDVMVSFVSLSNLSYNSYPYGWVKSRMLGRGFNCKSMWDFVLPMLFIYMMK